MLHFQMFYKCMKIRSLIAIFNIHNLIVTNVCINQDFRA